MNTSRLLLAAAAVALGSSLLCGADAAPEPAMKKLFDPNLTAAELEQESAAAAKAGVPKQAVAEAKLVWGLRHQDTEFLEKALPEFEAAARNFKKEDSAGMGSAEDFLALLSYIKGLAAMKKGDEAGFKRHITEAFWTSPEQAQLFAQAITNQRSAQKMAKIALDMKLPITTSKGEATTLSDQLGKNKAILLDFWASWCGPCMELMPELRKKADYLGKHNIAVAGMNTEGDEAVADKVRREKDMKLPWLVEPKGEPFSGPLGINSIPRMVLVSPEGKILYNGHPQDPALWAALKGVEASIEAPTE
jgi:thiol-disulfide isomerase/thioredoxin